MKHLDINLTKYVQDLHEENYKTLMKDIKVPNKHIPCSYIWRLNMDRCHFCSTWTIESMQSQSTPGNYLVDIDKLMLKLIHRGKRPRIANSILREKNKVRRLRLPDFKFYYKATIIKIVQYWWKNRQRVSGIE